MKTYTVIVRKEHCLNRRYISNTNCPLCAAIREQLPEFPLGSVAGWCVEDTSNQRWYFSKQGDWGFWGDSRGVWSIGATEALMNDEVKGVAVTFSIEGKGKVEEWKEPVYNIQGDFKEIQFTEIAENIPALSEN